MQDLSANVEQIQEHQNGEPVRPVQPQPGDGDYFSIDEYWDKLRERKRRRQPRTEYYMGVEV